ncbi:hypothetical protein ACTID9_19070 [Brevibacillus fluminis]|uniref:hypothetical protein n=1 Tax=Brevibacillus fluminis TaxID=511487 RepID=UPI003F88DC01
MNQERSLPILSLADGILSLADALGLFVTFVATEREKTRYRWQSGRFLDRSHHLDTFITMTVRTASGAIGQAVTSALASDRLEQAFHQAVRHASEQPQIARSLDTLAALEKRQLPLMMHHPCQSATVNKSFLHKIEAQHRCFSAHSDAAVASVAFLHERMTAARSDGRLFCLPLDRLICGHQGLVSTGYRQNIQSGVSSTVGFDDDLYEGILQDVERKRQDAILDLAHADMRSISPIPRSIDGVRDVVLDNQLLGQLLTHCLRLPGELQPAESKATLSLLQAEGSPAYSPIHPFGYLTGTTAIYSSAGTDTAALAALTCHPASHFHLSLDVPVDTAGHAEAVSLLDACRSWACNGQLVGDRCLVIQGMRHLDLNLTDGSFRLYPERLGLFESGHLSALPLQAVKGSLPALLPALVGGFGPMRQVWLSEDNAQVADLPRFTLARLPLSLEQGV